MSLLSDEEITLIIRECARGSAINRDGSTSHRIARAIEAAILAKLKEQGRFIPASTRVDKHDIEYLRDVFNYDPLTGEITWKVRRGGKLVGQEAGTVASDGYRYIRFDGTLYIAHRVAFALFHGFYPKAVDHINMVRDDNRIENLRQASVAENNRNKQKQSNNTSGYKGVSFHKTSCKFHARITIDGTNHSLGYFDKPEDAAAAYSEACKELHGEFARTN